MSDEKNEYTELNAIEEEAVKAEEVAAADKPDAGAKALDPRNMKNSQRAPFLAMILVAVLSLFFTRLPYITSGPAHISGYDMFIGFLGDGVPELALTGLMILARIVFGIAIVICCFLALFDSQIRMHKLKKVILGHIFFYLLVTIIPFFHIINIIQGIDDTIVGIGCYLNLGVGVVMLLIYIFFFAGKMEEM